MVQSKRISKQRQREIKRMEFATVEDAERFRKVVAEECMSRPTRLFFSANPTYDPYYLEWRDQFRDPRAAAIPRHALWSAGTRGLHASDGHLDYSVRSPFNVKRSRETMMKRSRETMMDLHPRSRPRREGPLPERFLGTDNMDMLLAVSQNTSRHPMMNAPMDQPLDRPLTGRLVQPLSGLLEQMDRLRNDQMAYPLDGRLDQSLSGLLNCQMDHPLNGRLDQPLSGSPNCQMKHPLNGRLDQPLSGSLNCQMNYPLNGRLDQPLSGSPNCQMKHPLNGRLDQPLSGSPNSQMDHPLNGRLDQPLDVSLNGQMHQPLSGRLDQPFSGLFDEAVSHALSGLDQLLNGPPMVR